MHYFAGEAKEPLEKARVQVADVINSRSEENLFICQGNN